MREIRVAVIGAGPAGIYAFDILTSEYKNAHVDLFKSACAAVAAVGRGACRGCGKIRSVGLSAGCRRDVAVPCPGSKLKGHSRSAF